VVILPLFLSELNAYISANSGFIVHGKDAGFLSAIARATINNPTTY
jgi:hypothetical protein